jgi:hypothetical protein
MENFRFGYSLKNKPISIFKICKFKKKFKSKMKFKINKFQTGTKFRSDQKIEQINHKNQEYHKPSRKPGQIKKENRPKGPLNGPSIARPSLAVQRYCKLQAGYKIPHEGCGDMAKSVCWVKENVEQREWTNVDLALYF